MVTTPYKIYFLCPEITEASNDGVSDVEYTHHGLLLWVYLFERLVTHRSVSVLTPGAEDIDAKDNCITVRHTHANQLPGAFTAHRRNELLWLKVRKRGEMLEIVLHGVKDDDVTVHWKTAVHESALSSGIDEVINQWLGHRQLALVDIDGIARFSWDDLDRAVASVQPLFTYLATSRQSDAVDPIGEDAADAETDGIDEGSDATAADKPDATPPAPLPFDGIPAVLQIAAWRSIGLCAERAVYEEILSLDFENSWGLLDLFEVSLNQEPNFTILRDVLSRAPAWGRPWLFLNKPDDYDDVTLENEPAPLEELGAFGYALVCEPCNREARRGTAQRLAWMGRYEARCRIHERTRDEGYYWPSSWLPLLATQGDLETPGASRMLGGRAANTVGLVVNGYIQPWSPARMRVDLHASNALLKVGLLGEAIVLRENRLEGEEARYPKEVEILEGWRKEPLHVARSYAREGYFRGEDARVLEGFSRAEPETGVDVAMYMESLVACGRAREALLAFRHLALGRELDSPAVRLAAFRAYAVCERYEEALEQMVVLRWRYPERNHHGSISRLGRMLASVNHDDLTTRLDDEMNRGAPTLARLFAFEIADFVVDADAIDLVSELATMSPARGFDSAWLTSFVDLPGKANVDAFFAKYADANSLDETDEMIGTWPMLRYAANPDRADAAAARQLLYIFTQSLSRYFSAVTQRPSILRGALRTIADESLVALCAARRDVTDTDICALFDALEPHGQLSPWLFDAWMARIERALHLDERCHGNMACFTGENENVRNRLRSPDQIALETHLVSQLMREQPEGYGFTARQILERLLPQIGPSMAGPFAQAVHAENGDDVVDQLLTAAWLSEEVDATACLLVAPLLFERDDEENAYDVLCRGIAPLRSITDKEHKIETVRTQWEASELDVPFEFGEAVEEAVAALQNGDAQRGAYLMRWLLALDPDNGEGHKNMGFACCMQGDAERALTHFGKVSAEQDTQMTAGVLFQNGFAPAAMEVLDYASRWYTRADQWLTFGAIAYQVMDNPRTVQAYANAWELDPDSFDESNLNSYAGVLDEVGDYGMCEKVARRLIELGEDDPMWESNGWHHLGCALIGYGRLPEAQEAVGRAIELNPSEENVPVFHQTLERARTGEKPEVPPLPRAVPRHEAFENLEELDIKDILKRWKGETDGPARIAMVRASRYRFGSDNYVAVTQDARAQSERVVNATHGTDDPDQVLARVFALDVREQAEFPADPLPLLGDRITREAFYKEFRDRGGIILGEPPVEGIPFEDKTVCEGTAIPSTGEYVRLLRLMSAHPPKDALAQMGISTGQYIAAAEAWGAALRKDDTLGEILAAGMLQ